MAEIPLLSRQSGLFVAFVLIPYLCIHVHHHVVALSSRHLRAGTVLVGRCGLLMLPDLRPDSLRNVVGRAKRDRDYAARASAMMSFLPVSKITCVSLSITDVHEWRWILISSSRLSGTNHGIHRLLFHAICTVVPSTAEECGMAHIMVFRTLQSAFDDNHPSR